MEKPTGPASWSWLPGQIGDRLAAAKKKPWREAADEVLIPRSQVRWPRYFGSLLNTPVWVDLGVSFRVRYEELTNPFRKGEFGTTKQVPLRTRARLGLSGQVFRFLIEFQDARSENVDPGETFTTSTESTNDILQLFGSATIRNVLGTGLRTDLHIGRLTMDLGRRRLVARNRFRNTTNAFDGAHWHLARRKLWNLRAFLVRPVAREFEGVSDIFGADDTLFWGVYYESEESRWLRTNLYYYGLNDRPSDPSELRQYSTFGLRFSKAPRRGEFDYDGETAWQVGTAGTTDGDKDHFAHMHHAEIGYVFNVRTTPRLVVQYDYASGTRTPGGSQHGTFDSLFGGRNWELMPTGIFGPFLRSNIISPGARIYLRPLARFIGTVMVKYR
ncbi:MAG: alginate export family protein, partial [Candidatus Binatia bacterium]